MHFNVILQRGSTFFELRFNEYGHVIGRDRYRHFPLFNHICSGYCGFHHVYYHTHVQPYMPYHNYYNHHTHHKKVFVHTQHNHHMKSEHHANKKVTVPRNQATVKSRVQGGRISRIDQNRGRGQSPLVRPRTNVEYERPQTTVRNRARISSTMEHRSRIAPSTSNAQQVRKAQPVTPSNSSIGSGRSSLGKSMVYRNNSRSSGSRH
jgi:hypothetical protein